MFLNEIAQNNTCGNPQLTIICKMLDIVNTAKVCPDPKMSDTVVYFMLEREKYLIMIENLIRIYILLCSEFHPDRCKFSVII